MLHSDFAALDWAIAEQQVLSLPECRPLRELALHGGDCVLLVRDQAMRVRYSVMMVSG